MKNISYRSTWWSNKHFRGSYSHRTPESDKRGALAAHLCTPITNQEGIPVSLVESNDDKFMR